MRDVSIATRSHVPSRFERALEAAPVTHPEEGGGPDPQRSRAHSLSKRGRPPGRFTFQFGGERAQSKPMPLPALLLPQNSAKQFCTKNARHCWTYGPLCCIVNNSP